jgi:hypothetical protein
MNHDHQHHHSQSGHSDFMSMIEMTKDLPKSTDGLPMENQEFSFGPRHPSLPVGISLKLDLDGDSISHAKIEYKSQNAAYRGKKNLNQRETHLTWLKTMATTINYRTLEKNIDKIAAALEQGEVQSAQALSIKARKRAAANLFLRLRLKNLAPYKNKDAYDRLLAGLSSLSSPENNFAQTFMTPDIKTLEKLLKNLEFSQALAAVSSFKLDPASIKKGDKK